MLRREAAGWLARLQSGRDPDVERKLRLWRDADPRNAAAFDRVRRSYEQAGLLRHSSIVPPARGEPEIRRVQWQVRPALAAAAILALLPVGMLLVRGNGLPFVGPHVSMLMTRVGEIRQFDLADGSKVILDTATKVDVEIGRSRRLAHLRYGRARFQVAKADAPFVVETAGTTITIPRGVIDVEQAGGEGHVEVLAGSADVRGSNPPRSSPAAIGSGQGLIVDRAGAQHQDLGAPADWTHGMLQFDGTPLAAAVNLANRYSGRHIILVGDLDSVRVTGAFRAGDTAGLAKALSVAFGLSLKPGSGGDLILSRNSSAGVAKKNGG
jgi:transmembrane sensor